MLSFFIDLIPTPALEQLKETDNRPQRLLKVVRSHIGKLFQFSIGFC